MVSNLNSQYQDFYIYGGNDITTAPFSLSGDGKTLTYTHKYSNGTTKTINMTMAYNKDTNTYSYNLSDDDLNNLVTAMREQGRVDIGYGDISNRQSLLDTYTGGLNMLTGLTSDSLNAMSDADAKKAVKAALETTPVALLSRSVMALSLIHILQILKPESSVSGAWNGPLSKRHLLHLSLIHI